MLPSFARAALRLRKWELFRSNAGAITNRAHGRLRMFTSLNQDMIPQSAAADPDSHVHSLINRQELADKLAQVPRNSSVRTKIRQHVNPLQSK